jgi:hypothetical protein
MDKKLLEHEKFIKTEIGKLEHRLNSTDNKQEVTIIKDDIQKLNYYHQKTVRDFQHERLIHLAVTFFFAALLLLSIVAIFLLALLPAAYDYTLLGTLVLAICIILFITEFFYVRHYYRLENGTQRLYLLSKKLYELGSRQ